MPKLKKVYSHIKQFNPKTGKSSKRLSHYEYGNWRIEKHGGASMMVHFNAYDMKYKFHHYTFTLHECMKKCDLADEGVDTKTDRLYW